MSLSPLTEPPHTPSPPSSPTFWKDFSPPRLATMSDIKRNNQPPTTPLTTRSGRQVKRSPRALAAEAQRPRKKQKKNVPMQPEHSEPFNLPTSNSTSSSPSPEGNVLVQLEHQPSDVSVSKRSSTSSSPSLNLPPAPEQSPNPYAHLSPPFEKFWDINAPHPAIPEPRPAHAFLNGTETLYFAYGKDMDVTYLTKKLGDIKFIAVGRISSFRWIIGKECRFPKLVPAKEERDEVWGLIYQIPEHGFDILNLKAQKRGLKMAEKGVRLLEKTGPPGFWNAPLIDVRAVKVSVMVGEWEEGDEMEEGEMRGLIGSKKRKLNGGILWACSEGLPEGWKGVLRGWIGGVKGPEENGYWSLGCWGGVREEVEGVRRSRRLKGFGKAVGKKCGK